MRHLNIVRLLISGVAIGVSGCVGPLVPVVNVDSQSALQLQSDVPTIERAAIPSDATFLGPINATSCMNKLWDRPPSRDDAIAQLRFMASQRGGNAISNVLCEGTEGTNLAKNCWASVSCHAVALNISDRPSEVRAVAEPRNRTGTGFFVNKQGYIITNQHVVDSCSSITARLANGDSMSASAIANDLTNDLAILRTNYLANHAASFAQRSQYRQGDQVVAYGFPLSGALSSSGNLTTGTVSALAGLGNDSRYVQISAPVQIGNSGGPLADLQGQTIGVVTGKLNTLDIARITGDVPQNVNFAIKDTVVKTFLDSHGIGYSLSPVATTGSVADIGDMLKRISVCISCIG